MCNAHAHAHSFCAFRHVSRVGNKPWPNWPEEPENEGDLHQEDIMHALARITLHSTFEQPLQVSNHASQLARNHGKPAVSASLGSTVHRPAACRARSTAAVTSRRLPGANTCSALLKCSSIKHHAICYTPLSQPISVGAYLCCREFLRSTAASLCLVLSWMALLPRAQTILSRVTVTWMMESLSW